MICFVPLGVAILLFHHYGYPSVATILAVVSMGALGGFASLQQRIQKIPTEGDPILTIFELQSGGNSLYLAPPEGAIFALVLFLTFLGGLIKGGLFPDLGSWPSIDLASYGKLFVWAFIAGFAERFVPDSLNSLIARAQRPAVAVVSAPPTSKGDTVLGDHTDGAKGRRKKH